MPKAVEHGLPWHQGAWRRVMGPLAADRMPHAVLVSGQPGTGQGLFARRLAARLLCSKPEQDEACGRCRSCQQLAAGSHPDLHVLTVPEGKTQIGIDQVRESLVETFQLSARYGDWKIAIIDPVDRMNRSSFNALLKTLEEPSGKTLLLLVSDRPARLPATIRSRCQRIHIPLPDFQTGVAWLRAQGVAEADALLRLAGGAPLTAMALSDAEWVSQRGPLCRGLMALVTGSGDPTASALAWSKLPLAQGLDWLQTLVHDLIRLRQLGSDVALLNEDLRRDLQSGAHRLDWVALHRHLDEVVRLRALSDAPLAAQLQWEFLMFAWSERLQPAPLQ